MERHEGVFLILILYVTLPHFVCRSAEGLSRSPTPRQLERCLDDLNAGRPQCPVGLHTLVVPRKNNPNGVAPEAQPYVYLNCGHVQVDEILNRLGPGSSSLDLQRLAKFG